MFEETAVKALEETSIPSRMEDEILRQLGELQLVLVGGGIGTVTIA